MPKAHSDYVSYTPKLVAELKRLVGGMPRADGVKALGKKLGLSERQARRAYVSHIEGGKSLYQTGMGDAGAPMSMICGSQGPQGRKIRRLFWDIETSPNVVLSWRVGWKLNIGAENILKERVVICISWKFEGEKDAHVLTWDKDQCDKKMLTEFLKVAAQADEMVAHNGDKFDMPWFKTRCLFHGLQPLPDYKTVDSLKWARSKFYFNSNRLDYIAKFLGLGGKIKTEFGLWKDIVLNKCPVAMDKMTTYCKRDVHLLEQVWKRLSQLMPAKTHVAVLGGGEKWMSPHTGTSHVKVSKTKVTASGVTQYQMQDLDSGQYYTISSSAHDAYLAAKDK